MRVDGTLMGMDEDVKKMIPQWRRGHFSMLFDASTQPANVFICDHQKKLFASMAKKKKVRDMDAEVSTDLHSFAESSHTPSWSCCECSECECSECECSECECECSECECSEVWHAGGHGHSGRCRQDQSGDTGVQVEAPEDHVWV